MHHLCRTLNRNSRNLASNTFAYCHLVSNFEWIDAPSTTSLNCELRHLCRTLNHNNINIGFSKHFRMILNWVSNFWISLRKFLACLSVEKHGADYGRKNNYHYSSKQFKSLRSWLGELTDMIHIGFLLTNQAIFKWIGCEH